MNVRQLIVLGSLFHFLFQATPSALPADEPTVRVEAPKPQRSRVLEKQTADAVVRDYLRSWQNMRAALEQNRPGLLDGSFVGAALDKLKGTLQQQADSGMHTSYQDRAHDLQIVFYSPDGLSIQLLDNVAYDQQVFDHGKLLATERVHQRYVVVLTPTEVRWLVRVMQPEANDAPVAVSKQAK